MLRRIGQAAAAWLTAVLLCMSCLLVAAHAEGSENAASGSGDTQTAAPSGEMYNDGQMNLDVVFVLDASGSMIRSDRQKAALDAYRLFVDLLDDTCGIGYVVFTHELLESSPVVNISDKDALEATKQKMASVQYDPNGFTDIALGLTKAKDLLTDPAVKGDHREKIIILLTDGNTALPKEGARSLQKSNDEMDATLMALCDYQIPVYAIGLNYDGRMKKEELQRIADETKGSRYETTTSEELVEIFSSIFAGLYQLSGEVREIVDGNVRIKVADDSVFTVSIIIRSGFTLQEMNPVLTNPAGQNIPITNSADLSVSATGSYVMLKLFYPDEGIWNLHLDKANNDNCVVTQMDYYNVFLEQKVVSHAPVGETVHIETTLKNSDGILQDKRLLNSITMNVRVVDENGRQTTLLMQSDAAGVYYCDWKPEGLGKYTVTTIAETPKFKKTGKGATVEIMTREAYDAYLQTASLSEEDGGLPKDSGNAWFTVIVIVIAVAIAIPIIYAVTVLVRSRKEKALGGTVEVQVDPDIKPAVQPPQKPEKAPEMKPATPPKLVDYEIVEHDTLENLIKKGPEDAFNTNADDYRSDAALEALIRKGPDNPFAVGKDEPEEEPDGDYEEDYGEDYGEDYSEDYGAPEDEEGYDGGYTDEEDGSGPLSGLHIKKD